jgi:hypothetical protein
VKKLGETKRGVCEEKMMTCGDHEVACIHVFCPAFNLCSASLDYHMCIESLPKTLNTK